MSVALREGVRFPPGTAVELNLLYFPLFPQALQKWSCGRQFGGCPSVGNIPHPTIPAASLNVSSSPSVGPVLAHADKQESFSEIPTHPGGPAKI